MELALKDLALLLEGELVGDGEVKVNNISKIEEGQEGTISFLANPKYEAHLYTTKASAVIVKDDFEPTRDYTTSLIKVKDPYSSFTSILEKYQQMKALQLQGRQEPIFIGENTEIGAGEFIAAFAYIGKNVKIGENVKIHSHAHIGDNTVVGDGTVIYSGVKIYEGTQIGKNCVLHANAVIGADGFGFAPQEDGSYKTIPQVGNVILEDDVSIGAGATVDCATMGSTIVRKGVKLDNQVQIGHNVEVGQNTVIAAQSGIAGSTKVGESCMFGGHVGIAGHIKVADRTKIGGFAGVNKANVEGATLLGVPAIDAKNFIRSSAIYKKLPELEQRVKELEKKC